MAVRAFSNNPTQLHNEVNAAIRAGKVITWQLDSDGDITHSPEQWRYKAWFRPIVENGNLAFYIFGQKGTRMTTEVYAVYHGRLIEMLLAHFDQKFSTATATAQPILGESVAG